jgi:hypothetical protein
MSPEASGGCAIGHGRGSSSTTTRRGCTCGEAELFLPRKEESPKIHRKLKGSRDPPQLKEGVPSKYLEEGDSSGLLGKHEQ